MMSLAAFLFSIALPPLLAFLIHCVLGRLIARDRIATALLSSGLAVAATVILVSRGEPLAGGAFGLIPVISVLSVHPYFNFFLLSETARRIHVLRCVREGKAVNDYSPQAVLQVRLNRLEAAGAVRVEKGILRAKINFLTVIALAIQFLEKLVFPRRFIPPKSHPSAFPLKGADECGR